MPLSPMRKLSRYIPLLLLVALMVTGACGTKKNTAGSRFWQAFNTRYNVYYHGKTNYDEQIKKLEDEYQDDYSQHVFVHPAEAYSNPKSPQPSGSFDRTIEKMQKAIALHSIKKKPKKKSGKGSDPKYQEWMKREEYNPFLHNAWYLMAKSQYMKGDFLSSSATFRYISRHFSWKKDLVVEAQVWEALSYCAMGWTTEADNVLAHIHLDEIEDGRVLGLANMAFADYYIKDKQYAQAIPYLAEAAKHAGGAQKVRLNFLLGQLYEENEQYDLAYEAFKRAGSSSSSSYRTKFNARIKQSAVFHGDDIEGEVRGLRHMTRYDRNKEYLDQIYYAIGNLYLSKQDTVKAVENYVLAAKKSTRNGIDKAISQLKLGGIYFDQHKYDLAQPCYSEAVPQLGEDYPNYKMLKQRSDVLDELAVYAQNVTLQDSLLMLSKMTPEEQRAVIKKIIDELKKKEKEEKENAAREEYLAQQSDKGTGLKNDSKSAPQNFEMNTDKSWYFYNAATKNAGKTQFQQRWGNRKLEDNWRRRNKNTFSLDEGTSDLAQAGDSLAAAGDSTAQELTKEQQEALKRSEDPHYEEYYLKQIPKTEEEIQTSNDVIQEGLYNMGLILKDKMEDLPAAAAEFEKLLERYPDNTYRLDTYYNLYLLHKRSHNELEAEKYRRLIITEFEESEYGIAMKDPNYLENLKLMEVEQEKLYDRAYNAYLNNDNGTVHATYEYVSETFPLSKIMPKFMFINALTYVTEHNSEKFKETLKEMLERYPDTDITPMASAMVKGLNQGRKINGSGGNLRGMFWSTRLSNDSTAADIEKQFTPFSEGKNKPQYFVLVYSTDSVSSNQLLYEVARHNFNSFVVKDFDLEQMNFGSLGLLIVKGFANHREVSHYRTIFEEDAELSLPQSVLPVIISKDNFELLLNEGRSFEDYFRYLDEQNNKDVESLVPQLQQLEKQAEKQEQEDEEEEEDEGEEEEDNKGDDKGDVTQGNDVTTPVETKTETTTKPESTVSTIETKQETTTQPETTTVTTTELETTTITTTEPKPETTTTEGEEKSQTSQSSQKDEKKDNTRRLKKQKDEETKRAEKEEKQRQDSIKRAEKEQEKLRKAQEKAERDSIKAAEKAEQEAKRAAEKEKEEAQKAAEKEKENAKKAAEQERKDKAKAKEEARKQKEKERKERAKQREKERKEQAKRKKEEAKARKEAAKQRKKEREEAAKERRRQREEERRNRNK